jgi:hypothetical protein
MMTKASKQDALVKWREAAARAMDIWRLEVTGTVDTLHRALKTAGFSFGELSLAHYLRPKGRRPRFARELLNGIAKVIAIQLADRSPDGDLSNFEQAIKRHIESGLPSPLASAPAPAVHQSSASGEDSASQAFDLWTPGQTDDAIIRRFSSDLGPEGAEEVRKLAHLAIDAISRGDFAAERNIAEEAIRLGQSAPRTPLQGEGLYLKAEATRLLADIDPDFGSAASLRKQAVELYGRAEEALRGDPRPIRGRARTIEVLGDLNGALSAFRDSDLAVEKRLESLNESNLLSLTHERVRTLRHRINCLAAMHTVTPQATLIAQRRSEELRHLILRSEPLHKESLGQFKQHGDWWLIEWFMAEVLHARGWVALKEDSWALKRLGWALECRLQMMSEVDPLSSVELNNLNWWAGIVNEARRALEPDQDRAFLALKVALDSGEDRRTIKMLGRKFLGAGTAPWSP